MEIEKSSWQNNGFVVDGEEYLVLLDWEANNLADDYLEDYLDNQDIPDWVEPYFDADAWKNDTLCNDGRGCWISCYDGTENEINFNGEWYFIYRVD